MIHASKNGLLNPRFGEKNPMSKLTKKDIIEIRKSKLSTRKTAKIYNVSFSHISGIRTFKKWAHVQ